MDTHAYNKRAGDTERISPNISQREGERASTLQPTNVGESESMQKIAFMSMYVFNVKCEQHTLRSNMTAIKKQTNK